MLCVTREKSETGIYHVIIRGADRQEIELFQKYNEQENNDNCLDDVATNKVSLSDEEARLEIINQIDGINIAQVKSLQRYKGMKYLLQKLKAIEGVKHRQAARILGISVNLIFKA